MANFYKYDTITINNKNKVLYKETNSKSKKLYILYNKTYITLSQ